MRLYHFTTERIKAIICNTSSQNMQDGLIPVLTPARAVREKKEEYQSNHNARWICEEKSLPYMHDISLWMKSKELGRLLFLLGVREGGYFQNFVIANFETQPTDTIFVCEADWLRRYHEGEIDTFDAHMRYAESRVSLDNYLDDYKLPEFRVFNKITSERLNWRKTRHKVIPYKTRPEIPLEQRAEP